MFLFSRFVIFRTALDAEMKDARRAGVALQNKKAEKLPVTEEQESKFWELGLLGCQSAKSLLNTVYYYNGKLFGLRGGEHSNITVASFELGHNFTRFEENVAKIFHGGLTDLKYEPRVVKHVCHSLNEKHECCLVELYLMYIGLVQSISREVTAFYSQPNSKSLAYDKEPVGINTLNAILPSMCKEAGFKPKSSHSLRVTCASMLFNAAVEEKLIRNRAGHCSNALFKYEKVSEMKSGQVSDILAPKCSSKSNVSSSREVSETTVEIGSSANTCEFMSSAYFKNCSVNINVNRLFKC